ncbi:flavodoxin domain-containing protein [Thermodesulfovibrionales bacterium]|nr:flavodoxin domain-containing protein [Thermodesulfovibrionales bacterium]MCL0042603.1 flavodoxin domain-containing protein [Thermodesulfovibrionales bacterium]MCL0047285.1 flavodoxin domain-containing protein [Thermodesulfovibrionales bacterium]MCL0085863.1 flavodoxin domain-containing protein [Thermodesulfovibrionales bacterium]MCL0107193.1 flavodoxin domain-containing protein [Thermodesulfovibrionales bacterium]
MKALIVCATKYGSTIEIGRWMAERLGYGNITADVKGPDEVNSLQEYGVIIMGSGIYGHGVLPELKTFVESNKETLADKKVALFGVAMKREPVFYKGKVHGGIHYLTPLAEMLNDSVIHVDMLSGEMVWQKMADEDKEGLMKFYKHLGLSDGEMNARMSPRTLMNKSECWEFTEAVMRTVKS